ncbi:MAG TPA: PadR family transcriptional regulator [Actinomycetota bacterium]|nr:PadR family transcriptional regulator [Actinomycetota bacterium]
MSVARVDVVMLGLLAEEPLYGYELIERFRARAMGRWTEVARASVYQALRRLEGAGLITGKAQDGVEGPDRRVYRITRPGRDRLRRGLLERFVQEAGYRSDPSVALGMIHALPPDEARAGIAQREAALSALLDGIAADHVRLKAASGPANVVARRMLQLQGDLARTEIAWLGTLRRDLGRLTR